MKFRQFKTKYYLVNVKKQKYMSQRKEFSEILFETWNRGSLTPVSSPISVNIRRLNLLHHTKYRKTIKSNLNSTYI